jgi:hypothetical protein
LDKKEKKNCIVYSRTVYYTNKMKNENLFTILFYTFNNKPISSASKHLSTNFGAVNVGVGRIIFLVSKNTKKFNKHDRCDIIMIYTFEKYE